MIGQHTDRAESYTTGQFNLDDVGPKLQFGDGIKALA